MKLYNVYGRLVNKNVAKYKMEWEKKSRSKLQFNTKQFFKKYWLGHVVYEEFPVFGTLLKVDILNATLKIAIEVQGGQHNAYNKFFHGNSTANYLASIKRDMVKYEWVERNGYDFLELIPEDIDKLSPEYIEEKFNITI